MDDAGCGQVLVIGTKGVLETQVIFNSANAQACLQKSQLNGLKKVQEQHKKITYSGCLIQVLLLTGLIANHKEK